MCHIYCHISGHIKKETHKSASHLGHKMSKMCQTYVWTVPSRIQGKISKSTSTHSTFRQIWDMLIAGRNRIKPRPFLLAFFHASQKGGQRVATLPKIEGNDGSATGRHCWPPMVPFNGGFPHASTNNTLLGSV